MTFELQKCHGSTSLISSRSIASQYTSSFSLSLHSYTQQAKRATGTRSTSMRHDNEPTYLDSVTYILLLRYTSLHSALEAARDDLREAVPRVASKPIRGIILEERQSVLNALHLLRATSTLPLARILMLVLELFR